VHVVEAGAVGDDVERWGCGDEQLARGDFFAGQHPAAVALVDPHARMLIEHAARPVGSAATHQQPHVGRVAVRSVLVPVDAVDAQLGALDGVEGGEQMLVAGAQRFRPGGARPAQALLGELL